MNQLIAALIFMLVPVAAVSQSETTSVSWEATAMPGYSVDPTNAGVLPWTYYGDSTNPKKPKMSCRQRSGFSDYIPQEVSRIGVWTEARRKWRVDFKFSDGGFISCTFDQLASDHETLSGKENIGRLGPLKYRAIEARALTLLKENLNEKTAVDVPAVLYEDPTPPVVAQERSSKGSP
jgi:hypothetical protein